jgi:hypothetical protein
MYVLRDKKEKFEVAKYDLSKSLGEFKRQEEEGDDVDEGETEQQVEQQ